MQTQTDTKQGRRPRWTEEEDSFLADQRRAGKSKKDIVAAYRARFPAMDRPDAGVLARIPSFDRANGRPGAGEDDGEEVHETPTQPTGGYSLGRAVSDIYAVIERAGVQHAAKLLVSVGALCGISVETLETKIETVETRSDAS